MNKCITVGFDPIIKRLKKNYKNINFKIDKFFNFKNFKKFKINNAKFITAIAMFYDLKKPNNFLCEIKKVLNKDGIFILEQSDLRLMLKQNSFDTICHEHLEYYSIKIIIEMSEKNGLKVFDHEYNESNGGSSRFYICHKENYRYKKTIILKKAIHLENKSKIDNIKTLKRFAKKINKLKKKILHVINTYKKKGLIHGYGASTKGNVLLQYFKVDKTSVWFLGWFLGFLISGCPACSITFASYLWLASIFSIFPYYGLELKILSVFLLLYANYTIFTQLDTCRIKR